jgi:hypothetical protein
MLFVFSVSQDTRVFFAREMWSSKFFIYNHLHHSSHWCSSINNTSPSPPVLFQIIIMMARAEQVFWEQPATQVNVFFIIHIKKFQNRGSSE